LIRKGRGCGLSYYLSRKGRRKVWKYQTALP
jgi:hypothetical protein